MNIKLEKIRKGIYVDKYSNRWFEFINKQWEVRNECTGKTYYISDTLKDCKQYQSLENDILLDYGRSLIY